jgi:hypothetical protein
MSDEGRCSPSYTWGTIDSPKGDAGLDGVYYSFATEEAFDLSTYRKHLASVHEYQVFLRDGTRYSAMPEEELENFDIRHYRSCRPLFCGRYEFDGSKGKLHRSDGSTVWMMTLDDEKLAITHGSAGTIRHTRLDRCNGLTLDGTYKRADHETPDAAKHSITIQ